MEIKRIGACYICLSFVFIKLNNFHFSTLKLNVAKKVWGKEGIIEKDISALKNTEDDDARQETKTSAENYQSQDSTTLVNIPEEIFRKTPEKEIVIESTT